MVVSSKQIVRLRLPRSLSVGSLAGLHRSLDEIEGVDGFEGRVALVLEGDGDVFCLGLDLTTLAPHDPGRTERVEEGLRSYADLLRKLRTFPRPSFALVEGFAAGGGVGLAAACDLVIAGSTARFALPEALLGLYPAIVLAVLDERVAPARSRRMALACESIDAEEAHRAGLVDRVVFWGREESAAIGLERVLAREVRRLSRADTSAVAALKGHPPWLDRLDEALACGRERTARALADPRVGRRIERHLGEFLGSPSSLEQP